MGMIKLCVADNRFEADVLAGALDSEGVQFVLRSYQDTAYDGLFVSQKGFGAIYVDESDHKQAEAIVREVTQANSLAALARSIEHTLLKPEATFQDLQRLLEKCLEYTFATACVCPWMVPRAAKVLADSEVAVCTVIDFPLGMSDPGGKLAQAMEAAKCGAVELDVVINRGLILSGSLEQAIEEIETIASAVSPAEVKVIMETSELGPQLTAEVAAALAPSGAAWLKTGSGHYGPATVEDVRIMRLAAPELGIKAAGGIRDLNQAMALLEAGAGRLGTSSGDRIIQQAREKWTQND